MVTTLVKKVGSQPVSEAKIAGFRRYMVLRSHPICLFWDVAASIWAVYWLWQHLWQYSVLLLAVERGCTWIFTQTVDSDALGKTLLGKMALLHLHPVNLVTQLMGLIIAIWGIWSHDTAIILGGVSVILLGHTFGWGQVHKALERSA